MGMRRLFARDARTVDAPTRQSVRRIPVIRSGTALEVAELAWVATGISRELALSIPACVACRNLIVGTIVQLELYRYRGDERLEPDYLVSKPDPSTTMPATLGGTVDDLAFRGRAYWRVLERDSEGYARRARWTPVDDVTAKTRSSGGAYAELTGYDVAGVGPVPVADVIRFDSPLPAILDVGGRALSAAIKTEVRAEQLSAVELPAGTLTNEGTELSEAEGAELVAGFQAARRENGIAFLQGVTFKREQLSSADLELVDGRAHHATEIARLWNVPVTMIGASPSGNASALLYSNLTQQLALLTSEACAPHLRTIEATLSDVIPRGQSVAFDVQRFLRSDPQAAADYAIALKTAGLITADEARAMLGIPASSTTTPDLTPGKV